MVSVMAGVMAVQTGLIHQVENKTSIARKLKPRYTSSHASIPAHIVSGTAGIGAAAMLFIFQGAFTIGFQATVWVYPTEILPLKLRQRGSSISTASNWICNFIIVYITPPAIRNLGWKTYIIFAVLNATWVPIMVCRAVCIYTYDPRLINFTQTQYFFYPETRRLSLEDVDKLFSTGYTRGSSLEEVKEPDVEVQVERAGKTL